MPTGVHDNSMLSPNEHIRLLYRMPTFSAYLRRSSDTFAIFRNLSFFFSPKRNILSTLIYQLSLSYTVICHFVLTMAHKNVLELLTS